jgi:uncharacterized protein YbaR (Trm112 family)
MTAADLPKKFLDILVCPKCKKEKVKPADDGFVCASCKVVFPIQDGLPNFLLESAKPL